MFFHVKICSNQEKTQWSKGCLYLDPQDRARSRRMQRCNTYLAGRLFSVQVFWSCKTIRSGGKLNYEKTKGIYICWQVGRNHEPVPIKWHTDHITILGANITNWMEQEWNKHTEKIENTLKCWSHRQLTIKGRATLLQTFAVAHMMYLAALFPIPPTVVQKLTQVMFSFLWETKNERFSQETCFLPPN